MRIRAITAGSASQKPDAGIRTIPRKVIKKVPIPIARAEVKFLFCIDLEAITLEPKPWSFRRLAVFIREQDLRACDFSRVWCYTFS